MELQKSIAKKTTIQGVGQGVVVDNLVIYGFADGDLVGFRVETGDVVWEKTVGKANSKFMDLNANIIKLGSVICTSDSNGNLYFINAKTKGNRKPGKCLCIDKPCVYGRKDLFWRLSGWT